MASGRDASQRFSWDLGSSGSAGRGADWQPPPHGVVLSAELTTVSRGEGRVRRAREPPRRLSTGDAELTLRLRAFRPAHHSPSPAPRAPS